MQNFSFIMRIFAARKRDTGIMMTRINLPRVDSTNNFCKDMLSFGDQIEGMTLVVTDEQTGGRGQGENRWESEAGKNLTFSLLCHPRFVKANEQFVLSQCMALAIWRSLDKLVEDVSIKWPNDIYIGDRKVSGTLIECDLRGKEIENCIIGVGLNVNQKEFRSDAPNPVSLAQITGKEEDKEALLDDIMGEFQALYERIRAGESEALRKEYKQHLYRREGMHRYADVRGEFMAEIADIEPTGHLLLRFENGNTCRYELKEVRFINDNVNLNHNDNVNDNNGNTTYTD